MEGNIRGESVCCGQQLTTLTSYCVMPIPNPIVQVDGLESNKLNKLLTQPLAVPQSCFVSISYPHYLSLLFRFQAHRVRKARRKKSRPYVCPIPISHAGFLAFKFDPVFEEFDDFVTCLQEVSLLHGIFVAKSEIRDVLTSDSNYL